MNPLILRLDQWLKENRSAYYQSLRPGVLRSSFTGLESLSREWGGTPLPATFYELYLWKNGQRDELLEALHYRFSFQTLEQVEYLASIPKDGWLAFAYDRKGSYLCLDMGGSFGGSPGQVVEYDKKKGTAKISYPTMENWLRVFVTSLEFTRWELEAKRNGSTRGLYPEDRGTVETIVTTLCPGFPMGDFEVRS